MLILCKNTLLFHMLQDIHCHNLKSKMNFVHLINIVFPFVHTQLHYSHLSSQWDQSNYIFQWQIYIESKFHSNDCECIYPLKLYICKSPSRYQTAFQCHFDSHHMDSRVWNRKCVLCQYLRIDRVLFQYLHILSMVYYYYSSRPHRNHLIWLQCFEHHLKTY